MIVSFGDPRTENVYHGRSTKRTRSLPPDFVRAARRKLDLIDAAGSLDDLRIPPGNRLEALSGSRNGTWSIRVNDQWRITFASTDPGAKHVVLEDYH